MRSLPRGISERTLRGAFWRAGPIYVSIVILREWLEDHTMSESDGEIFNSLNDVGSAREAWGKGVGHGRSFIGRFRRSVDKKA